MTKLMTAPYSSDSWELNITRINKTLYIEDHFIPFQGSSYPQEELFSYFGYKFESLATRPHLSQSSNNVNPTPTSQKVNTNIQFCSVFKTKLGPFSLILGGEVDCLYSHIPKESKSNLQRDYVELKTQRVLSHPKQIASFEKHKLLKIWVQSYLSGVPRIIIGFRDDDGILKEIKEYSTDGIWSKIKPKGYWNKHVCLDFAFQMLTLLDSFVKQDSSIVYSLKKTGNRIELNQWPSSLMMQTNLQLLYNFLVSNRSWRIWKIFNKIGSKVTRFSYSWINWNRT